MKEKKEIRKREDYKRKWRKSDGSLYRDEDIICIDFKTFNNFIINAKHETAFSYIKKFREESTKVRQSIPTNEMVGYLDRIEMEMQNFFLDGKHLE